MDDREAQQERAELLSRTFALITAKLEDAAALAAESQRRHPPAALNENVQKLREMLVETVTVADCAVALLS